jgi:hypothetical protein
VERKLKQASNSTARQLVLLEELVLELRKCKRNCSMIRCMGLR